MWDSSSDEDGGNGRKALWTPSYGLQYIDDTDNDGDAVFCIEVGLVEGSCPPPVGACCLQDPPNCVELETEDECTDLPGVWRGLGTSCNDPDIDCTVGACCTSTTECTQTDADGCEGAAPICDFATWGNEPLCFGDGDGDGAVDPQDVGLIKFFYSSPPTPDLQEEFCRFDLNCDGTINPADVGLCKFHYTAVCDDDPPLHLAPPGHPDHCALYFSGGGAGGSFYGYGTVCPGGREDGAITCDCICPDGALHECTPICDVEAAHDPPDPDCNGGCDEPGPPYTAFDPIAAGDAVCGTVAIVDDPAQPGYAMRDMDWFSFTTTDAETCVTWSVYADFVAEIRIMEADCDEGVDWVVVGDPGECILTELSLCLPPGDWYAIVAPELPGNNYTLPCIMEDNRYYATLTFGPCPTGACCLSGDCILTGSILECSDAGGELWFEGETCEEPEPFDCPEGFYCQAGAAICDEYIAEVIVGTIDNEPPPGTDCGAGGYQDWTMISTNLMRGTTYDFDMVPGVVGSGWGYYYPGDELSVWIDYNQNFVLDDLGENINYNVPPPLGFTFTVDPAATVGETRLRVRFNWPDSGLPQPDPCGNTTYGEVEDYTVNILP
jgi:hypothetical protein